MAPAPRHRFGDPRLRRLASIAAAFCLLAAGSARAEETARSAPRPGREVSLPASEVKDTFFAFLLGLIARGADIDVDNAQMREILVEFTSVLNVPADLISRFAQSVNTETGRQRLELDFLRDVEVPVPFALLFYHPGSVRMTRAIAFDVERSTLSADNAGAAGAPGSPVYVLTLAEGSIFADIDAWLEALFREQLEDSWITDVVFFRWHGDWIGMLEGRGKTTGKLRRAYFDYTKNEIVFPAPASLKYIGKRLSRDFSRP
jgi:hypothetical protein